MKLVKYLYVFLCLSLLALGGCGKRVEANVTEKEQKIPAKNEGETDKKGEYETGIPAYVEWESVNLGEGVFVFSVNEDGNIFVLTEDGNIKTYTKTGEIKQTYPNCIDFTAFCCENNNLYAYDAVKNEIVWIDFETGNRRIVTEEFDAEEVLKMEKVGNDIYMLIVPENYQGMKGENEYIDFQECLYRVSITDGSQEKLMIDNIIAIYAAGNGKLYYYAYQNDTYVLCEYDTVTGEDYVCYDMMEAFGVKYLSAFVYEQDMFVYSELVTPCIHSISLKDGAEMYCSEDIFIFSGKDVDCVQGNVVCLGYAIDGTPRKLQSFFVDQ